MFQRATDVVDKILRGTKPADISVEQPTKFDLIFNLLTAKALGGFPIKRHAPAYRSGPPLQSYRIRDDAPTAQPRRYAKIASASITGWLRQA